MKRPRRYTQRRASRYAAYLIKDGMPQGPYMFNNKDMANRAMRLMVRGTFPQYTAFQIWMDGQKIVELHCDGANFFDTPPIKNSDD